MNTFISYLWPHKALFLLTACLPDNSLLEIWSFSIFVFSKKQNIQIERFLKSSTIECISSSNTRLHIQGKFLYEQSHLWSKPIRKVQKVKATLESRTLWKLNYVSLVHLSTFENQHLKISIKSVHNFSSSLANKQIKAGCHVTSSLGGGKNGKHIKITTDCANTNDADS